MVLPPDDIWASMVSGLRESRDRVARQRDGWTALLAELRAVEMELGMTPLARQRLGIAYGRARLTAHDLNRILRERKRQRERDPIWDDWEEA